MLRYVFFTLKHAVSWFLHITTCPPISTGFFCYLFARSDSSICLASLSVLGTMATHCADFLKKRFADDVWPALKIVLKRQRKVALSSLSKHDFNLELSHRLQTKLLAILRQFLAFPGAFW